jgi:hypothetical protein
MAKTIIAQIRESVHGVDMISRKRNGNILFRKGYFYRFNQNEESLANSIIEQLTTVGLKARVVDSGDHWAPFKGSAPVAKQSHFYVELAVY